MESRLKIRLGRRPADGADRKAAMMNQLRADCHVPPPPLKPLCLPPFRLYTPRPSTPLRTHAAPARHWVCPPGDAPWPLAARPRRRALDPAAGTGRAACSSRRSREG